MKDNSALRTLVVMVTKPHRWPAGADLVIFPPTFFVFVYLFLFFFLFLFMLLFLLAFLSLLIFFVLIMFCPILSCLLLLLCTVHVPVHSFPLPPISVNNHVSLNFSYSVPIPAYLRTSWFCCCSQLLLLSDCFVSIVKLLLFTMRFNIHT